MSLYVAHRQGAVQDLPIIFSSWLRSFKDSHYAGLIPNNLYYDIYRAALEQLIARPGVEIWCAVNPQEEEEKHQIYGWLCIERGYALPVIHYLYVKQAYRMFGVARSLLAAVKIDPAQPFIFTFKTPDAASLMKRRRICGHFDPLLARRPKDLRKAEVIKCA